MLTIRRVDASGTTPVEPRDVAAALADATGEGQFLWVDLADPTAEEAAVLDQLALPRLLLEDMREDRHLPKVELLEGTLSLVVHGLDIASLERELTTVELDVAMRSDLLVTFHVDRLASVTALGERMDEEERGYGRPMLLLHHLLDTMNDVFLPFVDHLDKRLDVIEEDILDQPTERTRTDLYGLQRDVIQLRRVVVPQAEVVRRLGRERPSGWEAGDEALVRDLYDHLNRIVALSDSYHQLLSSAMDSYRSALDDKLNDMLATLTIISALLLPVSVIAGLFGMNFREIPFAENPEGFWITVALSGLLVSTMMLVFARRGWIGGRADRAVDRRRRRLASVMEVPLLGRVLSVNVIGGRSEQRRRRRLLADSDDSDDAADRASDVGASHR